MSAADSEAIQAVQGALRGPAHCRPGHVNPDGDTLGCVLALTHVLRRLGKDVTPLIGRRRPGHLSLDAGRGVGADGTERRDFDLAIVCDAGAWSGSAASVRADCRSRAALIDIDHHVADGPFGDIRILDATAAATAELIWKLLLGAAIGAGKA